MAAYLYSAVVQPAIMILLLEARSLKYLLVLQCQYQAVARIQLVASIQQSQQQYYVLLLLILTRRIVGQLVVQIGGQIVGASYTHYIVSYLYYYDWLQLATTIQYLVRHIRNIQYGRTTSISYQLVLLIVLATSQYHYHIISHIVYSNSNSICYIYVL